MAATPKSMPSDTNGASGSAPGKIILMGEHFVVHGTPAIALPLHNQRVRVEVMPEASAWHVPAGTAEHIATLVRILERRPERLGLSVRSSLPMGAGLGSSAALSVALVRALGISAPDRVRALAHQLECHTHGTASGVDDTVATFEQAVWFRRDEGATRLQQLAVPRLFVATVPRTAATREAVRRVGRIRDAHPQWFAERAARAATLVDASLQALQQEDLETLGQLMNEAHGLLGQIGVGDPRHDRLAEACLAAGAYGAKPTGAGLGGALIAVGPPELDLTAVLRSAGAHAVLDCT